MVMWWFWRHRIPFAAAILGTVASVTKQFPGTILVPFLCLFVRTFIFNFINVLI